MISVKFKPKFDVKEMTKQINSLLNDIKTKTYATARSLTPVRSGYAKSQWTKKSRAGGFSVENKTPYIQYLDKGSSKQAPKGITIPTVKKMTGYIKSRRLKR